MPSEPPLKKIIYILQTPLTKRDYIRHGMNIMIEHGADVTVYDISQIIHPRLCFKKEPLETTINIAQKRCIDNAAFRSERETLAKADLIIFLAQSGSLTRHNHSVLRVISKSGAPYLIWNGATFPGWRKNISAYRVGRRLKNLFSVFAKKDYVNSIIARCPPQLLGVRTADFALNSDTQCLRNSRLISARTNIIQAHHPDYDLYLKEKETPCEIKEQAVFIDQNMPFHHDFQDSRTKTVSPDSYYRNLEKFFVHIENTLNLEVVMAAHPRTDIKRVRQYTSARRIEQHATHRLILESKLVMAHSSSVVSLAILANKPLVILSTKELWRVGIERILMRELAESVSAPLVFVDQDLNQNVSHFLQLDATQYESYKHTYIKRPETPALPMWEILWRELVRHDAPPNKSTLRPNTS